MLGQLEAEVREGPVSMEVVFDVIILVISLKQCKPVSKNGLYEGWGKNERHSELVLYWKLKNNWFHKRTKYYWRINTL